MIYTVFPKDYDIWWGEMPQEFATMDEAQEYADDLRKRGVESEIEWTEGDVV